MTIEQSIIHEILGSIRFFTDTPNGHKFQCPYCQHGSKNHKGKPMDKNRVKGSLYKVSGRNDWKFRCFLCKKSVAFTTFLEDHFPKHFESYVRQREALGTTGKFTNCPKLETILKRQGVLPQHPPDFSWHGEPTPACREACWRGSGRPPVPSCDADLSNGAKDHKATADAFAKSASWSSIEDQPGDQTA